MRSMCSMRWVIFGYLASCGGGDEFVIITPWATASLKANIGPGTLQGIICSILGKFSLSGAVAHILILTYLFPAHIKSDTPRLHQNSPNQFQSGSLKGKSGYKTYIIISDYCSTHYGK